ncbi:MAG: DUF1800 domain-containing protein [Ardenticatenales bacterium]|nr:DUF1800 domain-containing protein [Ardenticatenales bacterium]
MKLDRRQFLRVGGAAAAAAATGAALAPEVEAATRPARRWRAKTSAEMPAPDLETLLLTRAAFGPRPGQLEHARQIGGMKWLEEQLDYENIDNSEVEELLLNRLPTLNWSNKQFLDLDERGQGVRELMQATIFRMVYSPRMLHEVMAEFWSDHFNVSMETNNVRYFKSVEDRTVIRKHALGKFKDLLTADAQSPAMLDYLDNAVSTKRQPNENYAREIMELHTTGAAVNGYPYSEEDIKQVAKCFTGWTIDNRANAPTRGNFMFNPDTHDNSTKTVFGEQIAASLGDDDGRIVIDLLCAHDATPRYIALKLARRFVCDNPLTDAPQLVERVASAFERSDGDIRDTLSALFTSREFGSSFNNFGGRLSRPTDLIVRMLRVSGLPMDKFTIGQNAPVFNRINYALGRMGHLPFYWATPDGYPDVKTAWAASGVMLMRWNVGLAMCGVGAGSGMGARMVDNWTPLTAEGVQTSFATAGEAVDYWTERLLHRALLAEDRQQIVGYLTNGGTDGTPFSGVANRLPYAVAMIFDSPYFQWR